MITYYDEKVNRLRDSATGRFALPTIRFEPVSDTPNEVCPNGCERYGDWWVPEDCPDHLGGF